VRASRSKRSRAGHLLVEALAGGVLLSLTLAALASGEVAARRSLTRGIEELELERAAAEQLEYLRAQPPGSAVWRSPSGGTVPGHPDWAWTITPESVEDLDVRMGFPSFRYLRARVTLVTPEGRTLVREALRW
jgi:hypothetical protein